MRLFFIGWVGKDIGLTEVVSMLKKEHTIVYWSGDGKEFELLRPEFPGTVFHDHYDALYGIPANGVDVSAFEPPSHELLLKLLETESTVLTMMNKRFESVLVSERKHQYYTHVRYWYGVLTTLKPEAIIFPSAPHSVYDYVIYGLAKLLSIRCILFELTVVGARSLVMRDFVDGNSALLGDRAVEKKKPIEIRDLPEDIRRYYEWQMNADTSHSPLYMRKQFKKYAGSKKFLIKFRSVWATLIVHKDWRALAKVFTHIPRRFMRNMKTEYTSVETPADFAKTFIYVPLSFQPERTSCPQGGIFADQVLMLEILSASVPADCLIYVKEHPTEWLHRSLDFFSYRYRGYYEAIAKLKNVRLLPLTTDTYALIEKATAVATVTGTAGWETLLRSKPVLVFGYPWYQHAPGLLKVESVETCKNALGKIASGFSPSSGEILSYLGNLGKRSFLGYCEPHGKEVTDIGAKVNADTLVRVIETELQK